MLIEILMVFEVLAFVVGGLAFWRQVPLVWAVAAILFAMLAVSAYGVEYRSIVVTNSTINVVGVTSSNFFSYGDQVTQKSDVPLAGLNIGLFLLSLVYFFVTLFQEIERAREG